MSDQQRAISARIAVLVLVFVVVVPFVPLLICRHWDWWEAWVYVISYVLGFASSRALAARRHPDVLAERGRFMQHQNAKSWDKPLSLLLGFGGVLMLLMVGPDALHDWSPRFSLPVKVLALVIILAAYALGAYALIENRFFSGLVRIQTDRGHHVVSTGPYRWMRHPGYAGALMTNLATPHFLDSRWAFLPAIFITSLLTIRTALEDGVLHNELTGYRDYARYVRYRLLPGIW